MRRVRDQHPQVRRGGQADFEPPVVVRGTGRLGGPVGPARCRPAANQRYVSADEGFAGAALSNQPPDDDP
jgi:hypothetical protein